MSAELRVPALGESVTDGVITRWLKRDGDVVAVDEPLFELETDKATMEIPATAPGRLEIVAPEGATVAVGDVVARIAEVAAAPAPAAAKAAEPQGDGAAARDTLAPAPAAARDDSGGGAERVTTSPAVRRLVAEHSLDPASIPGTGKGGRVTKADVLQRLAEPAPATAPPAEKREAPVDRTPSAAPAAAPAAGSAGGDGVRRVPMSRLRQRIAERLVEAQRSAAILTTFNEVDCQAIMDTRRRHRERFKSVHGVDLGLMSLFSRAAVLALADVPVVNARIDGTDIVYPPHVNLGIAVSTERGLVVPVIRNADTMSLAQLERAVAELASRARDGRLLPDDLAGGSFSITNGGVFGSLLSTPILNPPQSGILGMHKIQDRPVALDGQVVIRPMMYVALSYDHRLVDGQQAVTFLVRIKERLEDPVRMLLEV